MTLTQRGQNSLHVRPSLDICAIKHPHRVEKVLVLSFEGNLVPRWADRGKEWLVLHGNIILDVLRNDSHIVLEISFLTKDWSE